MGLFILAQYAQDDGGGLGWLILIAIWLAFGFWTANAAERKGYSRTPAFIVGVVFGIFGRIGYGVAPDRRLREQLDRERAAKWPPPPAGVKP